MSTSETGTTKSIKERMTYVVLVQKSEFSVAVYGPYRSFKRADGDAKAWGGSVEPLKKPGIK